MTHAKLPLIQGVDLQNFINATRDGEDHSIEVLFHSSLTFDPEAFQDFETKIRTCQTNIEEESASSSGKKKSNETKWKDFELEALDITFDYFESLSPAILFEHGFWCYIGYKLHDVIEWRHPNGALTNFGAMSSQLIESLFMRIYLRRRIGGEETSKLVPLQDYWRSHVLRVKLGQSPIVARAITQKVADQKLAVKEQRLLAKKINAIRSNVLYEFLDEEQAESFANRHVQ